ncbi:MAG: hypothetical protein Pars2KO_05110 [Parasphingorhabdus sp.]
MDYALLDERLGDVADAPLMAQCPFEQSTIFEPLPHPGSAIASGFKANNFVERQPGIRDLGNVDQNVPEISFPDTALKRIAVPP